MSIFAVMYYLIYGLLYLFSLLPMVVLYRFSDLAYFFICHVFGYRKKVVMSNLDIAFPEKSVTEKKKIARKFYRNFTDTFIESIKLLSISDKAFHRMVIFDPELVLALAKKGKSIQFHAGHQFNWELANWLIAETLPIPFIGVYMRINNKVFDRIFYGLRSKKGTVLVPVHEFRNRVHQLFNEQYSLGLAADQNPGVPAQAYWLHFFNRAAPFVTGPDKGAIKNDTAVVMVKLKKIKRGRYKFETELLVENGSELKPGELTLLYRDKLEQTIREQPDNYLWSHRRWKWAYQPEYEKRWIDKNPPLVNNVN